MLGLIPRDCLYSVSRFLYFRDLKSICCVNKRLNYIFSDILHRRRIQHRDPDRALLFRGDSTGVTSRYIRDYDIIFWFERYYVWFGRPIPIPLANREVITSLVQVENVINGYWDNLVRVFDVDEDSKDFIFRLPPTMLYSGLVNSDVNTIRWVYDGYVKMVLMKTKATNGVEVYILCMVYSNEKNKNVANKIRKGDFRYSLARREDYDDVKKLFNIKLLPEKDRLLCRAI